MPKKNVNSNHNVINIKIDNTKKTKKRSKRRKRHNKLALQPQQQGYSSLTPNNLQQQLPTNRPYYMETNSINPQLQDIPKPTTQEAFKPPPPPLALGHDLHSPISEDSLRFDKIYDGPPNDFEDHIPPPTGTFKDERSNKEQYQGTGSLDMFKTDYEHQMKNANRRAQYAEKVAPSKLEKAAAKLEKDKAKLAAKQLPKRGRPKKQAQYETPLRGLGEIMGSPSFGALPKVYTPLG